MSDKKAYDLITIDQQQFLEMVGELPFSTKQVNLLMQKTPEKFIKERPIPGGGKANFVETHYVIGMLNLITGYRWDFDVLEEKEKYGQIVIRGRLNIHAKDGETLSKTQYGRATIKFPKGITWKTDGADPVDYGNDHKSAVSDAIKKCASLFGIAWDVFGKDDMREMQMYDKKIEEESTEPVVLDDLEIVQKRVTERLDKMSTADRLRTLKSVGKVNTSNLTEPQWRRLDEVDA